MNKKAFTLVELSLVLSILALVIIGISSAKNLIHQSKLSSLIVEIRNIKQAYNTFSETYDAIPGDFKEAANYWSGISNGDGDTKIEWTGEVYNSFAHLNKAKIFPNRSGNASSDYGYFFKAIDGLCGTMYSVSTYMNSTNVMFMGLNRGSICQTAAFVPKDVFYIDSKIDDGKPKTGSIVFKIYGSTVTDALCTGSSSNYLKTSTSLGCNMVVALDHDLKI